MPRLSWILPVLSLAPLVVARPLRSWGSQHFQTLVSFGNSYTDESRLGYFISHGGGPPPVGWEQPDNNNTASGGYVWGHFLSENTNLEVFNYAVSGAVCSNKITPRMLPSINGPFPSVLEYEVPAYIADSKHKTDSGKPFMQISSDDTVYSMWIGTNDLGVGAFLTDSQEPNKTIPDYIECIYQAFDRIYDNGGRYFVLMNNAPLQLAPLYATPENHGVHANSYWPDKPENITMVSYRMWEQVANVNEVFRYQTPFESLIARRYPGASFAVMDMYGLFSDIYHNPTNYLSPPANVTGFINHCDIDGKNCEALPNPGSFLWFDELHPSERTDQIIAKEFAEALGGHSKWAMYW